MTSSFSKAAVLVSETRHYVECGELFKQGSGFGVKTRLQVECDKFFEQRTWFGVKSQALGRVEQVIR